MAAGLQLLPLHRRGFGLRRFKGSLPLLTRKGLQQNESCAAAPLQGLNCCWRFSLKCGNRAPGDYKGWFLICAQRRGYLGGVRAVLRTIRALWVSAAPGTEYSAVLSAFPPKTAMAFLAS